MPAGWRYAWGTVHRPSAHGGGLIAQSAEGGYHEAQTPWAPRYPGPGHARHAARAVYMQMKNELSRAIILSGFLGKRTFLEARRPSPYRNITLAAARHIALGWACLLFKSLCMIAFVLWLAIFGIDYRAILVLATVVLLCRYGPSWKVQAERAVSILRKAALENDEFFEFGIQAGLFTFLPTSETSGDLLLYMARVTLIRDKVLGSLAQQIEELLERADQIDRNLNPQEAEPLYAQAFELFREGYERYLSAPPEHYANLVVWKDQETLHGRGRPSVDEALEEAYIGDILDEYSGCLSSLAEKHRNAGRYAEADKCERRQAEIKNFWKSLRTSPQ